MISKRAKINTNLDIVVAGSAGHSYLSIAVNGVQALKFDLPMHKSI